MANEITPGVSALILAGGANHRLRGLVPSYLKPLILVNGKPLIQHAVRHASVAWRARQTVVVCSPDNAKALTQVVSADHDWVLQPEPRGVVDAISRALPVVRHERLLVLCSDNTFDDEAIGAEHVTSALSLFGARDVLEWEARRFTRFTQRRGPDGELRTSLVEASTYSAGPADPEDESSPHKVGCWIGPLFLRTQAVERALAECEVSDQWSIVDLINSATDRGRTLRPIEMRCEDLGVPEEL